MPIYEYVCEECQTRYEKIVRGNGEHVACPKCGSERKNQQFSVFSSPRSSASNGQAAGAASESDFGGGCGCTPSSCGCH